MINNVIRSATRDHLKTKMRCLTFCRENEKFISLLSKCNCEVYIVPKQGFSDWNPAIAGIPENIFPLRHESLISMIPYVDCVIVNDRLQEWDMGLAISQSLHVPMLVVDHVSRNCIQKLPLNGSVTVDEPLELRNGDLNVALSDEIRESWQSNAHGISITIPPYLQKQESQQKKNSIVVDNNLPAEVLSFIDNALKGIDVVSRFPESNLKNIKRAKIYINTWNNIDLKTLEAMQLGSIVISCAAEETKKVIKHEINGLLFSDMSEIPQLVNSCLQGKYDNIPEEAKQTALDLLSNEDSFVKKWNQVLSYISESFFVRN